MLKVIHSKLREPNPTILEVTNLSKQQCRHALVTVVDLLRGQGQEQEQMPLDLLFQLCQTFAYLSNFPELMNT